MLRNEDLDVKTSDSATTTNEHELDKKAMEGAKRGENRLRENEDKTPGNQIFTK